MKYLIVPVDEDVWLIDCSPSELEDTVKALIKEYSIHEGDRIYSCEYIGMVEKKVEFNFKPKEG